MIGLFEHLEALKKKGIYVNITSLYATKDSFIIRMYYINLDGERYELSKMFFNRDSENILTILADMEKQLIEEG